MQWQQERYFRHAKGMTRTTAKAKKRYEKI